MRVDSLSDPGTYYPSLQERVKGQMLQKPHVQTAFSQGFHETSFFRFDHPSDRNGRHLLERSGDLQSSQSFAEVFFPRNPVDGGIAADLFPSPGLA